jgi:hypothetical protein
MGRVDPVGRTVDILSRELTGVLGGIPGHP